MRWTGFLFFLALGNLTVPFANGMEKPTEKPAELFFPVEKNNIKVLPQRFEYQLLNKDQIQIGNFLIDARSIDFQILPLDIQKNRFKLRFQWPAGLSDLDEIAIKDNSGKGIWFQKIQKDQVKLSEDKKIAIYETVTEVPSLVRLIQLYPFFKFCVHREEPLTKIYLCSKDLYLRKAQKNQIAIQPRDSFRPQSFVEINGQSVGNQGMIFLNSSSDFISMRALLLSGATLELDTRVKKVNFKDVYLSADGKQLIVKAQGAKPVDPEAVEYLTGDAEDEWQTRLDIERPFTYLQGEGGLPLRQEFLIQGPVRPESVKVFITSEVDLLTFQGDYDLNLKPADGLSIESADKKTRLAPLAGNEYKWTLLGLRNNQINRRYLKVLSGDQEFTAAYDIERRPPLDASLRLLYPLWAQLHVLYTPSTRWGISAQYDQSLDSASSDLNVKIGGLSAQYRFPSGLHLRDQIYWVEIAAQSFQSDSTQLMLYGLGVGAEWKSPELWSRTFPWVIGKLRFPVASSASDLELKTGSFEGELSFRQMRSSTSYWELGLRSYSFVLESSQTEIRSSKTFGLLGMGWIF